MARIPTARLSGQACESSGEGGISLLPTVIRISDPWVPGVTLVVFTFRDPNSKDSISEARLCDCIGTASSATEGLWATFLVGLAFGRDQTISN